MSVTAACFKWADVLENQFDKSWVDLDTVLGQLEEEEEFNLIHKQSRRAASSLASCFSQLAHKSTTVFQNNAKLEAELVHLREEVAAARAGQERAEKDRQHATALLRTSLEETQKLKNLLSRGQNGHENSPDDIKDNSIKGDSPVSQIVPSRSTSLPGSPCSPPLPTPGSPRISSESTSVTVFGDNTTTSSCDLLPLIEKHSIVKLLLENKKLRAELLELESEMVGARLDNVYLDKELAGRIQQIQLLLASNTPADRKEKMWSQIESEMCLQRSKTIAQMCKTKQEVKCRMREESNRIPIEAVTRLESVEDTETDTKHGKQVMILKNPADDLGMAIIGGYEHNLPIIISEIFPGTAVARSNRINAGDIILTVNGENFSNITHPEAVNFLSSLRGQIIMELQSAETVSEDDPSNLDYRFYKIFDTSITKEGVDHVSVSNYSSRRGSSASHPGRAIIRFDVDSGERLVNGEVEKELPSVHSSPRRQL